MHLFPNAITAFGLVCGLFVIFKMAVYEVSSQNFEALQAAAIFLLIASVADLMDGTVARLLDIESDFGVIFDSISDSITFGVAPSVVILKSLDLPSGVSFPLMIAAMIFTLCGVLRLIRYSVQAYQMKNDADLMKASKKNFTGLPIPAAASAAVSANLFLASGDCNILVNITQKERAVILICILVVLGYFMISKWKFPSLKALHIRIRAFPLIVIMVSTAALLLYSILNHFPTAFFIVSWSYVIIAWVLSIARLISGKKSNTLADFEPEPPDDFEYLDEKLP